MTDEPILVGMTLEQLTIKALKDENDRLRSELAACQEESDLHVAEREAWRKRHTDDVAQMAKNIEQQSLTIMNLMHGRNQLRSDLAACQERERGLREALEHLVVAMESVEWNADGRMCPVCFRLPKLDHAPGCAMRAIAVDKAALAQSTGGEDG